MPNLLLKLHNPKLVAAVMLLSLSLLGNIYLLLERTGAPSETEGVSEQKSSGLVEPQAPGVSTIQWAEQGSDLILKIGDEVIINDKPLYQGGETTVAQATLSGLVWKEVELSGLDTKRNLLSLSTVMRVPGKKAMLLTTNSAAYDEEFSPLISGYSGGDAVTYSLFYLDFENLNKYGYSGFVQPIFVAGENDFYNAKAHIDIISLSPDQKHVALKLADCFECEGGTGSATVVAELIKTEYGDQLGYVNLGRVADFSWQSNRSFRYRPQREQCRIDIPGLQQVGYDYQCLRQGNFVTKSLP